MTRNRTPYLIDLYPRCISVRSKQIIDKQYPSINYSPKSQQTYQQVSELPKKQSSVIKNIRSSQNNLSLTKSSVQCIKRPKQYCPLLKKQLIQTERIDKKLEYIKSSQYRQYLQRAMQGAKSTQDLIYTMKKNRNNKVYIKKNPSIRMQQSSYTKLQQNIHPNCSQQKQLFLTNKKQELLNLSPISSQTEQSKINFSIYKSRDLDCQPYLNDSTFAENLKIVQTKYSNKQNQPKEQLFFQQEQFSLLSINHMFQKKSQYKRNKLNLNKNCKNQIISLPITKQNDTQFGVQKAKVKYHKIQKQSKELSASQQQYFNLQSSIKQLKIVYDTSLQANNSIYCVDFKLSKPSLAATEGLANITRSQLPKQRAAKKKHPNLSQKDTINSNYKQHII